MNFSPINSSRLNDIRIATDSDSTLQQLKQMILQGWPTHKSAVPSDIAVFFDYRDELTIQDGIVLRGNRVVIPVSLRNDMKQRVHAGHLGINSCLQRARKLIYWPGMSRDIRQYVQACPVCATYPDKQPPETLKRHDLPERPWQNVGTDIFTFCDRMMRKCKMQHEDPYLGLLNIRNSVNEGWRSSPSQRMFGRATKTLPPTTSSHLQQSKVITDNDCDRVVK